MGTYTIEVKRGEKDGTLKCSGAKVNTKCWWDMKNAKGVIPAGTYSGCSATTMATKGHHAIFLPNVKGWKGIFIHVGNGPNASAGCLVIKKAEMEKLYGAVDPKDGKNVTVKVIDTKPQSGGAGASKKELAAQIKLLEKYLAQLTKTRKVALVLYESNAKQGELIYREMKRMSDGVDVAATVLTMAVSLTKLGAKGAKVAKATADEAAKISKQLAKDTAKDIAKKNAQAAAYIVKDAPSGDSSAWLFTKAVADSWFKLTAPSFWAHTYVQIAKDGKSWSDAVTYDPAAEHRQAMAKLDRAKTDALRSIDDRIKNYRALIKDLKKQAQGAR